MGEVVKPERVEFGEDMVNEVSRKDSFSLLHDFTISLVHSLSQFQRCQTK